MKIFQTDGSSPLFIRICTINILIFLLVFVKTYSDDVATVGGLVIIGYVFLNALTNPKEAIYLFFGIKLTFDALWELKIFGLGFIGKIGLLELMILPVIYLTFFGKKMSRSLPKWPVGLIILYVTWVFCAMLFNDTSSVDVNLLIRQACLLFGLIIGLKYIETIEDFQTAAYFVFLSTIIPVLAALMQSTLGAFIDLPFFHYKMDSTRGLRASGLFYDPATMGMVVIISLVMNLYLLQSNLVKQGFRNLHYLFIPVCIYVGIIGSTRSIIFTSLAVTSIFLISNIKRAVLLLPFILLTIILSQPYLENVFVKTSRENVHQSQFKEMLHETESRTMFTGRVGIWQDIWDKHKSITWVQQLFGTGMSSNAHSTYFFLLLQIGWLGLILYLFYHYRLIIYFARAQLPRMFIYILMGTVLSNLLMGISASTVNYTSFQIAISFIMGAGIAIAKAGTSEKIPIANTNPVIRYYKDLPLGK
jgi:hypothetical protein